MQRPHVHIPLLNPRHPPPTRRTTTSPAEIHRLDRWVEVIEEQLEVLRLAAFQHLARNDRSLREDGGIGQRLVQCPSGASDGMPELSGPE